MRELSMLRRYVTNGLFVLVFLIPNLAQAFRNNDVPESFSDYRKYELGGGRWPGEVYIAPALVDDLLLIRGKDSSGSEITKKIVVNYSSGESYNIIFDTGPSDDPTFHIFQEEVNYSNMVPGSRLFVSAFKTFYSRTNSNESFPKSRKYALVNGDFKEVKQPFYYIGGNCPVSESLTLYESQCGEKVVATLPKGSNVTLVLAAHEFTGCQSRERSSERRRYLVATPFGLSGWVSSSVGYLATPGKPLSCLRYLGD